jgi:plastocyanin
MPDRDHMGGSALLTAAVEGGNPVESILTWLVLGLLVLVALIVEGIPPALAVAGLTLFVATLLLLRGRRKWAIVLVAVADLAFLVVSMPHLLTAIAEPTSTGEFVAAGGMLAAGVGVLVSLRTVFDNDRPGRTTGVVFGGLTVVALALAYYGVVRLMSEDIEPRRPDHELIADGQWFSQVEITLRAGSIDLELINNDLGVHTFVIDEFDVSVMLPGGAIKTVNFTAPPGEYEYYCSMPDHTMMRGRLIVLEHF